VTSWERLFTGPGREHWRKGGGKKKTIKQGYGVKNFKKRTRARRNPFLPPATEGLCPRINQHEIRPHQRIGGLIRGSVGGVNSCSLPRAPELKGCLTGGGIEHKSVGKQPPETFWLLGFENPIRKGGAATSKGKKKEVKRGYPGIVSRVTV